MIYRQMFDTFRIRDEVRTAVIGAGQYATAIVTQERHTPYLRVTVVADVDLANAREALAKAGWTDDDVAYAATAAEAEAAIAQGRRVYTDQPAIVARIGAVDIVVESTGVPEAGARYAFDAIANGKHVAMVTKDLDVTIGPILRRLADEKGVVYTPVDGDQHGLLIQLVEWAKSIGLSVITAGKATDGEFVYDPDAATVTIHTDKTIHPPFQETVQISPEDAEFLGPIPEGAAAAYIAERARILAALPQPGSYDLCEMTVAANYTGFAPQVDTLLHAPLRITEIPLAYAPEADGGVIRQDGTIDLATCLREPAESGLGGGVFIVVRADNAYSNHIMVTKGQIANADGSATVIYRPYHLCGVETSTSLLVAGLLGLNTGGDDYRPRFDLVKVAARDIAAGEVFGNDHSPQLTARIVPGAAIGEGNPAAAHLLTGNRAAVDIPAGTLITYDLVERPADSLLWELRERQDAAFLA
ncbi:SAF domain-containing protein [Herbiconiux sp. CPCC 203407]|uniref:SAF domain-containing protein n=1 Tax=Herbiconiux oxytropis TaxID=2970915 RepID=A0AA41XIE3_9MICO|nr:SAF domain-containing protein [Herbiconiux oxytropis]MCS5722550.1 SAF domain-containing protein [Herbiconiux oxytropis]MCS5726490.1 SAF domain-containing protein [Herbiconiux oxytropis]